MSVFFVTVKGCRVRRKSDKPRLDQVCCSEQSTKQDTDTSYDNIGDPKERIASTHDSASTDQD